MVVEAVIIVIAVQWRGVKHGSAQRVSGVTVRDLFKLDQQPTLMRTRSFNSQRMLFGALTPVKNLPYGETNIRFVGADIHRHFAFNSMGFHHATNL